MTYKAKEFSTLLELMAAIPNEDAAVEHFTATRWKNGPFCPYCGHKEILHFADKRRHRCLNCNERFSIRVGTIFQDSRLPIRTWLLAIWFITSHKKGISSIQLGKDLGVTQKTAWFMMHRLRHAARTRSFNRLLKGNVEVDETFVGGKEANKHAGKRAGAKNWRKGKAVVVGMLERGGELRAQVQGNMRKIPNHVVMNVKEGSNLMTDEWGGYRGMDAFYNHQTVNHASGEYARGAAHVNGIEGYWSQLKRQIIGIHHWVSRKHLDRYVAESVWRFNRRMADEGSRFNDMLKLTDGRLRYDRLTA